jgi:hypothetical protein
MKDDKGPHNTIEHLVVCQCSPMYVNLMHLILHVAEANENIKNVNYMYPFLWRYISIHSSLPYRYVMQIHTQLSDASNC